MEGEHETTVDAEQVARNDAIFRDSNDRIDEVAERIGAEDPLPFICECAKLECREVMRLTAEEYQRIRSHPARFAVVPGHEQGPNVSVETVERSDRFWVVEKTGRAKSIAAALDPRSD